MAYRADTIGGRLKVESSPTGGVRIVCLIPIEKIGTRKVQPC
jgi:signal transduction histidine kinase